MPRKSELYTSFVTSAKAMAMSGGNKDQMLCCTVSLVVKKYAAKRKSRTRPKVNIRNRLLNRFCIFSVIFTTLFCCIVVPKFHYTLQKIAIFDKCRQKNQSQYARESNPHTRESKNIHKLKTEIIVNRMRRKNFLDYRLDFFNVFLREIFLSVFHTFHLFLHIHSHFLIRKNEFLQTAERINY